MLELVVNARWVSNISKADRSRSGACKLCKEILLMEVRIESDATDDPRLRQPRAFQVMYPVCTETRIRIRYSNHSAISLETSDHSIDRHNIGAFILTYTTLGVPYHIYSIHPG